MFEFSPRCENGLVKATLKLGIQGSSDVDTFQNDVPQKSRVQAKNDVARKALTSRKWNDFDRDSDVSLVTTATPQHIASNIVGLEAQPTTNKNSNQSQTPQTAGEFFTSTPNSFCKYAVGDENLQAVLDESLRQCQDENFKGMMCMGQSRPSSTLEISATDQKLANILSTQTEVSLTKTNTLDELIRSLLLPSDMHIQSVLLESYKQKPIGRSDEWTYAQYVAGMRYKGYEIFEVEGDGHCFYQAVSHQLIGETHTSLRNKVATYIESHKEQFQVFLTENIHLFLDGVRGSAWGDHIQIHAVQEIYSRQVEIFQAENPNLEPLKIDFGMGVSTAETEVEPIRLSYRNYKHFDSVLKIKAQSNELHNSNFTPPTKSLPANTAQDLMELNAGNGQYLPQNLRLGPKAEKTTNKNSNQSHTPQTDGNFFTSTPNSFCECAVSAENVQAVLYESLRHCQDEKEMLYIGQSQPSNAIEISAANQKLANILSTQTEVSLPKTDTLDEFIRSLLVHDIDANDMHMQSILLESYKQKPIARSDEWTYAQYVAGMRGIGYEIFEVKGDGHCFYHAVSHQLIGETHTSLRNKVAAYIEGRKEQFQVFLTENIHLFLDGVRGSAWGDHIQIHAVQEIYSRQIEIFQAENPNLEPLKIDFGMGVSTAETEMEPIRLSYRNYNHFDSVLKIKAHSNQLHNSNITPPKKSLPANTAQDLMGLNAGNGQYLPQNLRLGPKAEKTTNKTSNQSQTPQTDGNFFTSTPNSFCECAVSAENLQAVLYESLRHCQDEKEMLCIGQSQPSSAIEISAADQKLANIISTQTEVSLPTTDTLDEFIRSLLVHDTDASDMHMQSILLESYKKKPIARSDEWTYAQYVAGMRDKGYEIFEIKGDGHCFYHAVSHQLIGETHNSLRNKVAAYIESHKEQFQVFLTENIHLFLDGVRGSAWGDHIQIHAIQEIYSRQIEIFQAENPNLEPLKIDFGMGVSTTETEVEPIRLSYRNCNHYDPVLKIKARSNELHNSHLVEVNARNGHYLPQNLKPENAWTTPGPVFAPNSSGGLYNPLSNSDLRNSNPVEMPTEPWFKTLAGTEDIQDLEAILYEHPDVHTWIDAPDAECNNFTPLVYAAYSGKHELVKLLLEIGNPNIEYETLELKRTALHHAVASGSAKCLEILLIARACIDKQDSNGHTALHLAARCGDFECLRLLLHSGASKDIQDKTGCTPLMLAAEHRNDHCLQQLIQAGADINVKDTNGQTALMKADMSDSFGCLHILLEIGAAL